MDMMNGDKLYKVLTRLMATVIISLGLWCFTAIVREVFELSPTGLYEIFTDLLAVCAAGCSIVSVLILLLWVLFNEE